MGQSDYFVKPLSALQGELTQLFLMLAMFRGALMVDSTWRCRRKTGIKIFFCVEKIGAVKKPPKLRYQIRYQIRCTLLSQSWEIWGNGNITYCKKKEKIKPKKYLYIFTFYTLKVSSVIIVSTRNNDRENLSRQERYYQRQVQKPVSAIVWSHINDLGKGHLQFCNNSIYAEIYT